MPLKVNQSGSQRTNSNRDADDPPQHRPAIIKNGTVHFPRTEYKELLGQIFNLGVKLRDDLCDGLTTLLQGLMDQEL